MARFNFSFLMCGARGAEPHVVTTGERSRCRRAASDDAEGMPGRIGPHQRRRAKMGRVEGAFFFRPRTAESSEVSWGGRRLTSSSWALVVSKLRLRTNSDVLLMPSPCGPGGTGRRRNRVRAVRSPHQTNTW